MATRVVTLRAEVRALLEARVDARYLATIRTLVPSGAPILGVRVPAIRTLVKAFPAVDLESACALVDAQFASRCREEMLFGVFLLGRFKRQLTPALWPKVDGWIDAIENWETCDQLAMVVAGQIVAKNPSLLPDLQRWVRSPNRWRRRFALATTTTLKHAHATLAVCEGALGDSEPIVRKALGWALREACKNDERAVLAFLAARRVPPAVLRHSNR